MKTALVALACTVAVATLPMRVEAGPVKHWGAFPDREVRAVALRGDQLGGESSYTAVQGRDGYVYLRGRRGLYRMLDLDGRYARVANTEDCSGWFESQGVDNRGGTPLAICTRAAQIILAGAQNHWHKRAPRPTWPGAFRTAGQYRVDNRFLTAVQPASGGGYWFAYGLAVGVGRMWPSGQATVVHLQGLDEIRQIVGAGDDLYVLDNACRVGRLRALTLVAIDFFDERCAGARPYWPTNHIAAAPDGAVWLIGSGLVERRARDGARRRWELSMIGTGIAISRDGTAYVLGRTAAGPEGRLRIAVIAPGRAPAVLVLPMTSADTIAIDGRDRIWISVPEWHAAAVISPAAAKHT